MGTPKFVANRLKVDILGTPEIETGVWCERRFVENCALNLWNLT